MPDEKWVNYWNDASIGATARAVIVGEIAGTGANVIFEQYSGVYTDRHFVDNTEAAFQSVFLASAQVNGPQIIPSLEATFQCGGNCPGDAKPVFDPARDIAPNSKVGTDWIVHLVNAIKATGRQDKWAQIFDSSGTPRYAIQIAQATSVNLKAGEDAKYFEALNDLQLAVWRQTGGTLIGFILTPVEDDANYSLIRSNPDRVADLRACISCLAVLPYVSEISRVSQECEAEAPQTLPGSTPPVPFRGFIDCNYANDGVGIRNLARFKKDRTKLWVNSGNPYYLDLDGGYDAHLVFNPSNALPGRRWAGTLWGETAYLYDAWRNSQSELKGHQGDGNGAPAGIVYNSWNGYTEVAVAVDSTHLAWNPSTTFCQPGYCESLKAPYPWGYPGGPSDTQRWRTDYNFHDIRRTWLKDVFSVDPRLCDHYYYENGQRKFHVFGAICEKFTEKYGEYGPLGVPAGNAYQQGNWAVENFEYGQIYWNNTGAHEMHGGIYAKYKTLLQSGRILGAPLTDELSTPDTVGRYNHFEYGSIYWTPSTLGVGIWGAFRDRWAALQWERGRLGYPTLEPTKSNVGSGWYEQFQGGNMYTRSLSGPAFEVSGSILAEYGRLGWERSWLGYPITGELDSGYWCTGGRYNQFEHGYIDWCPGNAACAHNGNGRCTDGRARPN
jgi:hypothetical protein